MGHKKCEPHTLRQLIVLDGKVNDEHFLGFASVRCRILAEESQKAPEESTPASEDTRSKMHVVGKRLH